MSSPTRSPCTAMPPSHSGQWVMGSVPPSRSIPWCQTHKNALPPSLREGRRALCTALVIPPSCGAASRQHPRRVQTYSRPLTGASGKAYSRLTRFLLATPGFCSQVRNLWAFHQPPSLWMPRHLLLFPSTLLCYFIGLLVINV